MKYLLSLIILTYAATTAVAVHGCHIDRGRTCEAVSVLLSTELLLAAVGLAMIVLSLIVRQSR